MTCKECIDYLELYQKGTLPDDTKKRVVEHLLECPDCRATLEVMQSVDRFIGLEKSHAPNTFLTSKVMANIQRMEEKQKGATIGKLRPLFFAASVAATIAFGIFIGSLYQNGAIHPSNGNDLVYIDDASLESIHQLTSE